MKKRLLWIGDAGCESGFALATHQILDTLRHVYDVSVLGINYRGDQTGFPAFLQGRMWTAMAGGDGLGVNRLIWICDMVKPDIIVIQNDPWNVPLYLARLMQFPQYAMIPIVAAMAVDGKNLQVSPYLKMLTMAVFWTEFGLREAQQSGYDGPATVIPLGVDLDAYYPMARHEARAIRLPFTREQSDKMFIVGNVNRNQPRKRWDLTLKYFAEWVTSRSVEDAYLYLHTAPTGDLGCDVNQLAEYYGILDRVILVEPKPWNGLSEDAMRATYNCFDVQISTTQGEGFGLTTLEGMACGVPQIVPDWSALGEWAAGAAFLVPCTSTSIGWPYLNVIGGIPDEAQFIDALDTLYCNQAVRQDAGQRGYARAREDRFRWASVGARWLALIDTLLEPSKEVMWQDLGRSADVEVEV